ncbi:MAG: hypothetical protein A2W91_13635 [Bacteroidetes bacterium GWF2_38_335]|nr:MAG: hypothetical protein A2W91_13635 [Bacteroidetes bacterium GWF2_38_335]OFY77291.1 MAG: hypothetical protein A2281_15300 [Bacteroidetes bacterium RIFOXYA12_FULL_38_20]HBS85704.1 hypothetical protein [Bacteroidales bacterium]
MDIPLNQFEKHIDENILHRGYQYFNQGKIAEHEEIDEGIHEFVIEGTEDYCVHLEIEHDCLTDFNCDCPYDSGPVCKHVVAALYYLQQLNLENPAVQEDQKKSSKKKGKKKMPKDQIDEILEKLPHDELKNFIRKQSTINNKISQLFISSYVYLIVPDSKELYIKQIKAIFKSASDRHGYIDYKNAHFVGHAVYELVESAGKQVASGNYTTAINIACAVLEEMTKALNFADDSDGDIGSCIDPSVEILFRIASGQASDEIKLMLFDYCINAFKKNLFDGWDWHYAMLELAVLLAMTNDQMKIIGSILDKLLKKGLYEWDFQTVQNIQLALIKKSDGEEKAIEFIEENSLNPEFRKILIEKAISEKNYDKAINLAESGIKNDEQSKPGLANNWLEYLLKVHQLTGNVDEIIKYARMLFIDSNREKSQFYSILKKYIPAEKWKDYIAQIIKDYTKEGKWTYNSFVYNIYIWEEDWKSLFELVKRNPSLYNIELYEKYLINDYQPEIVEIYRSGIMDYVYKNLGRSHYKTACKYIKKVIIMGNIEKASEIVRKLKELYPQRRALIEELNKIKI